MISLTHCLFWTKDKRRKKIEKTLSGTKERKRKRKKMFCSPFCLSLPRTWNCLNEKSFFLSFSSSGKVKSILGSWIGKQKRIFMKFKPLSFFLFPFFFFFQSWCLCSTTFDVIENSKLGGILKVSSVSGHKRKGRNLTIGKLFTLLTC